MTEKEQQAYAFILRTKLTQDGRFPSYRELRKVLHLNTTSTIRPTYLQPLVDQGYLIPLDMQPGYRVRGGHWIYLSDEGETKLQQLATHWQIPTYDMLTTLMERALRKNGHLIHLSDRAEKRLQAWSKDISHPEDDLLLQILEDFFLKFS